MSTETHSVPRDAAIPADKLYSHFKKLHSHQVKIKKTFKKT